MDQCPWLKYVLKLSACWVFGPIYTFLSIRKYLCYFDAALETSQPLCIACDFYRAHRLFFSPSSVFEPRQNWYGEKKNFLLGNIPLVTAGIDNKKVKEYIKDYHILLLYKLNKKTLTRINNTVSLISSNNPYSNVLWIIKYLKIPFYYIYNSEHKLASYWFQE